MKRAIVFTVLVIILGFSVAFFASGNKDSSKTQITDNFINEILGVSDDNHEVNGSGQSVDRAYSDPELQLETEQGQDQDLVSVIRIIDGDTIEIEGGQKVRYIGIDTPESTTTLDCFGREAAAKNRELVEGKSVKLEKDVSETDKYGRLLRYVFLPAGRQGIGEVMVNDQLVREGYAYASSYPPDVKHQDQFRFAQQEAQSNKRGLWDKCTQGASIASGECQIKGNISSSGERIYHMPGQKYWEKTVIDEARGERWFCKEEEAQSAGFRKSKI